MDAPADQTRAERQGEMLQELAEIGLELARDVADLARRRLAEARESGWDHGLPADPGAAFARLAQSVRRSIALEAHLREGGARETGKAKSLFAFSGPPLDLDLDFAAAGAPPPPAADRLIAEAKGERDGRETIAADLGSALEPRERLFEIPIGCVQAHIAAIRDSLGLDVEPTNAALPRARAQDPQTSRPPSSPPPLAARSPLEPGRPGRAAHAPNQAALE